jgi:hypothetical protein
LNSYLYSATPDKEVRAAAQSNLPAASL